MGKVKLRKKPISKGRMTLYLDIYPPVPNLNKKKFIRFHYLRLYIYQSPKLKVEKTHNRETLNLAKNICAKRQLEIQNRSV
ncbi:hypothetical protein [Olivibacter domesticus]|uniref:Phage integrase SAM-like domain-containing protein n=1 Tax=Olivibacter domesticus TaxID=407022 RepID=A0A1H7IBY9_OLID1|nr:Phage integrase SAM-like domain-containing protein [Olivibacter domesticus]